MMNKSELWEEQLDPISLTKMLGMPPGFPWTSVCTAPSSFPLFHMVIHQIEEQQRLLA